MGEIRNIYKVWVGIDEGKRPLGIARRSREDNIRMVLKERVWESVDWIRLSQDRDQWHVLLNTLMNLGVS
jgi:hypothetical protein